MRNLDKIRIKNEEFHNQFWCEQKKIHVGYVRVHEVETLEHSITNCIVEIRNSTRINQVFEEKEEEIS